MRVLVGCEYSGTVREAFRKLGHDAWSCDLLPADDASPHHIQGDVFAAIASREWDLICLHPPCTALCVSGNAHYGTGMQKHQQRIESAEWTRKLWDFARKHCPRVALENPVGVLPRLADMPVSQYIQPWQFGHAESKRTGLWLAGLSLLAETDNVKHEYDQLPKSKQQRLHWLPPSKDRWKIRSKTFDGIAAAMADQWSLAN